jgi:hypothetical protein
MFSKTLDNKPEIVDKNGNTLKDLTESIFNDIKGNSAYSLFKVSKEYVMRPDLISNAIYNTTEYTEIILKYNAISNPFTINENDIILAPNLDDVEAQTTKNVNANITASAIRNSYKYIDPDKIPKKNVGAIKYEEQQKIMGATETSLPPNISGENENQIEIQNGRVYFGRNITQTAECLKDGMTVGEYLTTITTKKTL